MENPTAPASSKPDSHAANEQTGQPLHSTTHTGAIRMRAGDPDRAKIAAILQDAVGKGQLTLAEFEERTMQAWDAVYLDQLVPLTADLIAHQATAGHVSTPRPAAQVAPPAPSAASRITGGTGPSFSMAIWSGFSRKGMWTVPSQFTAFTLMGGGELDLRQADYASGEVTITAVAIMGGIEIIVPDDVHVHVNGVGFMGAFEDARKWNNEQPTKPASDAPVVRINGLALMGGIEIVRKPFTQRRIERS